MPEDHRAELSVPRLLALLAAAVEKTTQERNGGRASWGQDIAPKHHRDTGRSVDSFSALRIRDLRRVYNILLFGGPSHNEIVAQAAWEDNSTRSRGEAYRCGVTEADAAEDDGSSHDAISSISATISAVSLEMRSTRRYDPANALEGLVDELIGPGSRQVEGQHEAGATSVARALRLLTALRGEGGQARGADDWELVGGHGRRVLERLYDGNVSSGGGGGQKTEQPQRPQHRDKATTASLPVAMFFRDGQGCNNNAILRPSRQLPVDPVTPPPEVSQTTSLDAVIDVRQRHQQRQQQRQQQQYLLPDDCVLHGDSTATAAHRWLGTAERIPWFTDAEFASERGLPDASEGSSLGGCLKVMSTAPLSPAAWTRLRGNAAASGDSTEAPSFWAGSGGSPAARTVAPGANDSSGGGLAETAGQHASGGTPLVRGGLDLCGALSQARVDARSPAVRELRLALSFPDLEEDRPPDLLEAARLHQRDRPTDHPASVRCDHGSAAGSTSVGGVCPPVFPLSGTPGMAGPPPGAVQENLRRWPRSSIGNSPSGLRPLGTPAPAWGVSTSTEGLSDGKKVHGFLPLEFPARELGPVGWEQAEADWHDPSFPKWALACAPLVTAEGGGLGSSRAFESCFREHFGAVVGLGGFLGEGEEEEEGQPAATAETRVARRALAVLQGVPSGNFWYDERHARMRVFGHRDDDEEATPGRKERPPPPPPRVAGVSPGALSSLLKEFATAGTWYRRVEKFAACLVGRSSSSSSPGQVAHAFGVELRRQLTAIHSALLVVTAEFAGPGWDDGPDPGPCGVRGAPPARRGCSLAGALVRTARLRRALGALAEVCGLSEEDLGVPGGVRAVFREFPRGAALLSHLYRAAEIRVASRPAKGGGGEGEVEGVSGTAVMGEKDSALALLSSAAAPYLVMLGRWLWSGEMRAEDDPCKEFLLRCRERVTGGTCPTACGRGGAGGGDVGSEAAKEPWIEDGGGSFMALAFSENEAAGVPCFLEGGVLVAAARAGKLLRMLKLSSPAFYAACSASPPPPLSLVFGARALASRVSVFERLRLLRAAAGRSAAREIRARVAEKEMRKGMASGVGSEQLLAGEKLALGKLELQRERDDASVKEARRIWVQGLEGDRADADAAAASAAAAIAATNATAAVAVAAAAAADDGAENRPSAAASGGGGVLSFLDPPTSEAEAFAAAAITERYRVLSEGADARAARARWKRQRSARAVAARASLILLYAEESHLWTGLTAKKAVTAAAAATAVGHGTPGNEVMADGAARNVPKAIEATPAASPSSGSDRQNGRVAEQAFAEGEGHAAAGDSDGGGTEIEVAEAGETVAQEEPAGPGVTVPEPPGKHRHPPEEDAKFSPVKIVEEPGGKSTNVSAALGGGPAAGEEEAPRVKFSGVNIVQDPGGASRGVSGALGGGDAATATAGSLPGRSGLRRIVQEPGGNSSGVSRIMSHDETGDAAADREAMVGTRAVDSAGVDVDPLPRASIQGSSDDSVGLSLRAGEDVRAAAAAAAAAAATGGDTGSHARGRKTIREEPASSGVWPEGEGKAEGKVKGSSDGGAAPPDRGEVSGKRRNGRSFLPEFKGSDCARGRARETHADLPLEVIVRRCVREPVLAQCSAVDSAALAFLVRDAGVAEHLASLRTFLLGLTSDFLHDFTLRLLDGLYDGGVDWRRTSNLAAAFAASSSATGLDSVPLAETFRYEVDPTCGGVLGAKSLKQGVGSTDGWRGEGGSVSAAQSAAGNAVDAQVPELYSPAALAFVSPILEVKWPVGVLLPVGVAHTYVGIHRALFRHQLTLHRLRRLRVALRELDACVADASSVGCGGGGGGGVGWSRAARLRRARGRGGGGGGGGGGRGAGVSWDRGRLHWLHLFRHEMQHMADSLQSFFAEHAEAGWPDLRRSLSVAGRGGGGAGGLAALVTAHSRYISRMHRSMFLGADRQGALARARIGEFYEAVCAVGRITDGLLPSKPSPSGSASGAQQELGGGTPPGDITVLPDGAFAELAAAREKFDAARRGFCAALSEICAGGGARARPLLATVGYGGYGGQDVDVFR